MLASRLINNRVWYVEYCKGEGGADWGYTHDRKKAQKLGQYWISRFKKDMEYCKNEYLIIGE